MYVKKVKVASDTTGHGAAFTLRLEVMRR